MRLGFEGSWIRRCGVVVLCFCGPIGLHAQPAPLRDIWANTTNSEELSRRFREAALRAKAAGDEAATTSGTATTQGVSSLTTLGVSGLYIGVVAGAVAAAVAAAGGKSKNSNGSSADCGWQCVLPDTSTFSDSASSGAFSTEYYAGGSAAAPKSGLPAIDAKALNDYGYTGRGVRVAVVDSGIDGNHPEFAGRTGLGTNFAESSVTAWGDCANSVGAGCGHGTHVAGIIGANRDGANSRGVAYDATLYSYRIGRSSDASPIGSDNSVKLTAIFNQHASDQIKVSNNSWGSDSTTADAIDPNANPSYWFWDANIGTLAAAQSAVRTGTIFVWATGNSGKTQPSEQVGWGLYDSTLKPQWLAVMAVEPDSVTGGYKETSFSNRCGVAKSICLAAPGYEIYSAASGATGLVDKSGTSMAAPHVSGVLATMAQAFPSLTSPQLVERLKVTAGYDNLSGKTGQTLATSGLSVMQDIFGYGLINAQRAMSRIGIWVLPMYSNYYSGTTSLSDANLRMPSGLSTVTQSAMRNAYYTVFDSFDGAGFSVRGNEYFSQARPRRQASMGYGATVSGSGTGTKYQQQIREVAGAGTPLRLYAAQNKSSGLGGGLGFWGDKVFLLPRLSRSSEQAWATSSEVQWLTRGGQISVFMNTAEQGTIQEHGVGYSAGIGNLLSWYGSIGRSRKTGTEFALRLAGNDHDLASDVLKLGLRVPIGANLEFFGFHSVDRLASRAADAANWGIKKGAYQASAIGLEWVLNKTDRFSFGFFMPEQLTSGQASVVVPKDRQADGTVVWERRSFDLEGDSVPGLMMAGRRDLGEFYGVRPIARFQAQTNPAKRQQLESVSVEIDVAF
jgi:subtilase-type serine protease